MINDILTAALDYAARGIPVFPVKADKSPATAHGLKDRTTDADIIRSWFDNENDYQIAGVPADWGGIVLDPDTGHDPLDMKGLPETRRVITPSGTGRHWYYQTDKVFGNGRWAPKIDVRSGNGYVLLPPSRRYTIENPSQEIAQFPEWAEAQLRQAEERIEHEPVDPDLVDLPHNIERAKAYLNNRAPAVEGNSGDQWTYETACGMRDLAISTELALDLMDEEWNDTCEPPWSRAELAVKVTNAYAYAKGREGKHAATTSAVDLFKPEMLAAVTARQAEEKQTRISTSRFMWRKPSEDENLPDLEFWDDDKMLPKVPAVGIIYGDSGAHKTNMALRLMIETLITKGAVIAYCAGEGSHGVRKLRVPAQARARGMTTKDLDEQWRTVTNVPLLSDPAQVEEFIEVMLSTGRPPDIVVLDTWSTAAVGLDDNASITASMLTDNGPIGRIKNALGCLVLIIDHTGKIASKGVRGTSAKRGNVDVVLFCEANKDAKTIALTCEKLRDGPDGHSTYWKIGDGVPVPEPCDKAELRTVRTTENDKKSIIEQVLRSGGYNAPDKYLTSHNLALKILPEGDRENIGKVNAEADKLCSYKDKGSIKKWNALIHNIAQPGQTKQWVWYIEN
jgi:hypothetical protein